MVVYIIYLKILNYKWICLSACSTFSSASLSAIRAHTQWFQITDRKSRWSFSPANTLIRAWIMSSVHSLYLLVFWLGTVWGKVWVFSFFCFFLTPPGHSCGNVLRFFFVFFFGKPRKKIASGPLSLTPKSIKTMGSEWTTLLLMRCVYVGGWGFMRNEWRASKKKKKKWQKNTLVNITWCSFKAMCQHIGGEKVRPVSLVTSAEWQSQCYCSIRRWSVPEDGFASCSKKID